MAASKGSAAGVTAGVVIAALVVVVMVVLVVILVVVLFRKKGKTRILPTRNSTRDNGVELQPGTNLDNPVYGPGVEQTSHTHTEGEPEHRFINPLYHLVQGHERAESVSGHEYATLRTPYRAIDGVIGGREKDCSHYESEEC